MSAAANVAEADPGAGDTQSIRRPEVTGHSSDCSRGFVDGNKLQGCGETAG